MIVITMTDCPIGLRGDMTKWCLEISPGVFVGQVSARVRDHLWSRIQNTVKDGRVTMVFNTNNEQRLDFRIHNSTWEPIDFDGIKLMLRPSPSRTKQLGELRLGFSKASKHKMAKRSMDKRGSKYPDSYVVIDIETSGLSPDENEIIEIGAILVQNHQIKEYFNELVRPLKELPLKIVDLTGITDVMLQEQGVQLTDVLQDFITFVKDYSLVSHNIDFDFSFLQKAFERCNLPPIRNRRIDTLSISRREITQINNYKLETLAEHFGIEYKQKHRSIKDCETTYQLFEKLIKLTSAEK